MNLSPSATEQTKKTSKTFLALAGKLNWKKEPLFNSVEN